MEEFNRCEQMTDAELVRWSFLLAQVAAIDTRLSSLGEGFVPSSELAAAQDALRAEIARRTKAKGEQP